MKLTFLASLVACAALATACHGGKGGDSGAIGDDGVDADGDGYTDDVDCDDSDASVNPGADEVCNGIDDDCDGEIENGLGEVWYDDADGDGFGDDTSARRSCDEVPGATMRGGDCDDTDAAVNPDAPEVCNDIDDDCDEVVDWGLRVPADIGTITGAMDAAEDGDTVCVAAGTYSERLDFAGKAITVKGVDGSSATTLDGLGEGPAKGAMVAFDSGETGETELIGFTVTGGEAWEGAGVYISHASPTLTDIVSTGNACSGAAIDDCYGVGLYCVSGAPSISGSSFDGNEASSRSGGYANAYGVGLYLLHCDAVLQDVSASHNLHVPDGASSYVVSRGVGAYLEGSDVVWSGGLVSGNTNAVSSKTILSRGMGIYVEGGNLRLSELFVSANVADGDGSGSGGGIYSNGYADLRLTNLVVAGNSTGPDTSDGRGGGIFVDTYTDLVIENCDIVGNEAVGFRSAYGGGIAGGGSSTLTMVNTTVVDNTSSLGNELAWWDATAKVSYSNFPGAGDDDAFEGVASPVGSNGNISADPEYADVSSSDPAVWDLTLDSTSPCIDAGDPNILDADGSVSDIGAYGGPRGGW